jgi:hypothetical protein
MLRATMPYILLVYGVQIGLIVHCMRTGRNTIWIWVLLMLPMAGGLAYFAVEILPQLLGTRTARRTMRGVKNVIDPEKNLRQYETAARFQGGVANQQRLAEELVERGRAGEAIEIYRSALSGLYEHDPNLMSGLARAQFANQQPADARATLDSLIKQNPEFKSQDGHLLYARSLEGEGNIGKALDEFR